jgi:predicted ribosome quality control (RQC) complex YloA/Tae2 family protein
MSKQRFSALDIAATIAELSKLQGLRLANIYDINARTFLLKFQKPDLKEHILIESGVRIHTTSYIRDKQQIPSQFNTRLRKYLKTKRLTKITQIGADRRIMLSFGSGEFGFNLIVEFFATGNIILTDNEMKIVAVLRIVDFDETSICVGNIYDMPVVDLDPFKLVTKDFIVDAFDKYVKKQEEYRIIEENQPVIIASNSNFQRRKKKNKRNKTITLKGALRTIFGPKYGTSVIDHSLGLSGLDLNDQDLDDFQDVDSEKFSKLFESLQICDELILNCVGSAQKGYIIAHPLEQKDTDETTEDNLSFDEFHPFKPSFLSTNQELIEFDSFDMAVDEFFSKIETQKLAQKQKQAELQALKKLDTAKKNNINQIMSFQLSQEKKEKIALSIEMNLAKVQAVIDTVSKMVSSGVNWDDLKELVMQSKEMGDPVASLICELKLEKNIVTIKLPNPDNSDEDDGSENENDFESEDSNDPKSKHPIIIDLNLDQSAYANARTYYDAKKLAVKKGLRTVEASKKGLEIAEQKIMKKLSKQDSQSAKITKYRPPFWFEKFLWFVSTENFLCIGARDLTQNEMLLKKYMKNGDVYVNSDMKGACGVLIKTLEGDVSATTLQQAGTMSVCQSHSWDAKIITSAYWVSSDQVLKSGPAGELPLGEFFVKGKKNYLPPVQLVYGVALMFTIDDICKEKHMADRRPWLRDGYVPEKLVDLSGDIEEEDVSAQVEQILVSVESKPDLDLGLNQEEIKPKKRREPKEKKEPKIQSEDAESITSSSQKLPRGKKSKLKKIQSKYADQDEEDRAEIMEFLASAKGPQPKGKKEKKAALQKQIIIEKIEKQHQKTPTEKEYIKEDVEFEIPDFDLDILTGQPIEDDVVLNCIPVSAPWIALQKFKFKIKVVPGGLKKGKAATQASNAFIGMVKSTDFEDHVKDVADQDWINCMLGKSKLQLK